VKWKKEENRLDDGNAFVVKGEQSAHLALPKEELDRERELLRTMRRKYDKQQKGE